MRTNIVYLGAIAIVSSLRSNPWRPKWELCCILLLTSNKVPLKAGCLSNRLSTISTFARKYYRSVSSLWRRLSNHVLGSEIEHVSLMFISEHESRQILDAKWILHILSFYNENEFLCNPEICLTASVIHSELNLITNIDFEVTLWPEAHHLMTNFACNLVS